MNHIDLTTAIAHDIRARSQMRERSWTGLALNTVAKRPAPARAQATRRVRDLVQFVLVGEVISHA